MGARAGCGRHFVLPVDSSAGSLSLATAAGARRGNDWGDGTGLAADAAPAELVDTLGSGCHWRLNSLGYRRVVLPESGGAADTATYSYVERAQYANCGRCYALALATANP